jgi:FkbM family methyltransferase
MLIFDIGANVGKYALANYHTANTIISVEASPATYISLCSRTIRYRDKIKCINRAVSNSSLEYVTFYDSPAHTISTLDKDWLSDISSRFFGNSYNEIKVPSITLDELVQLYGVPDLLKIDVEGAENIVIKSLSKKVKQLCFEWASEWNAKTFECIDHLEALGYDKFHIQMQDNYTYRPSTYEYTASEVKDKLLTTVDKVDWGMIWTI